MYDFIVRVKNKNKMSVYNNKLTPIVAVVVLSLVAAVIATPVTLEQTKHIRLIQDKLEKKDSSTSISFEELLAASEEYENLSPEQKFGQRTEPGFRLVIDLAINRIKPYADVIKENAEGIADYIRDIEKFYQVFTPGYMKGSAVTTDEFVIPKVESLKTDLLIEKLANKESASLSLFYEAREEARSILEKMEELTEEGIRDFSDLAPLAALVNFFNDNKHKPLFMSVYPAMDSGKFGRKVPKSISLNSKENEDKPEPELQGAESRSVDILTKKYHDQLWNIGRVLLYTVKGI